MTILEKAITYALKAHTGEKRKNSTLPYILHPLEALVTAASLTDDMEVLAAVVLHDTVEDTGISLADIEREFGHYVAWLVDCETEDTIEYETEEITWNIRKQESIDHLRITADKNVRIIWLCDKLSNLRAIRRDYDRLGENIWNTFHMKDPARQAWYYRTIAELLKDDLGQTDAFLEYSRLVEEVFHSV
jgi:(p)ppGpp synthase/HD superfamily hydrolase